MLPIYTWHTFCFWLVSRCSKSYWANIVVQKRRTIVTWVLRDKTVVPLAGTRGDTGSAALLARQGKHYAVPNWLWGGGHWECRPLVQLGAVLWLPKLARGARLQCMRPTGGFTPCSFQFVDFGFVLSYFSVFLFVSFVVPLTWGQPMSHIDMSYIFALVGVKILSKVQG